MLSVPLYSSGCCFVGNSSREPLIMKDWFVKWGLLRDSSWTLELVLNLCVKYCELIMFLMLSCF